MAPSSSDQPAPSDRPSPSDRPASSDPPAYGPGDDWPDDNWADDEWPDDDRPGDHRADYRADWPAAPRAPTDADLLTWLFSNAMAVALVAVLAGVAGAFVAFLLIQGPPASPAATSAPNGARSLVPNIGGRDSASALPGGTGGQVQILVVGKVTAVGSTSITVAAQGNAVTGAVTGATKVTGKVTGIGGVKVGDQVLVKFTGTPGSLTAATIQDPASIS